ncbi:arf-GAP with coiled-coil, ANK repeat and PH domain-containing protein 3 [Corvus kubaryi]|uniref:arf-GAP with coiled-coil, ANK repeat and PH domain-containing protein 3 n=1 Tax=Corvus kubaryi TaxID=68294 RepID=UPI001C044D31|nr:arf-GAP with coiled-coil, ANK repeat and PH domain-containing protein 3 [Corvus kubaryi]
MTVEFEECIKDSPRFRATIDEVETDVVEIEAKLDKLVKLCSGMIEAGKVYITTNKHFVSGVRDLSQQCKKDEMISECLEKFGDSLQEMINYHMILFDQAQRSVRQQLHNFVKDPPPFFPSFWGFGILESAAVTPEQLLKLLPNFSTCCCSPCPQLDQLVIDSAVEKREMEHKHALIQQRTLLQDFSYDDSKVEFNVDAPNGVVMEGYLFKRASNAFKTWNRRWFSIQNSQLVYQKKLKDVLTVVVEDLRLCTVKPCEDIERRFCFEVVSPTKSCMLQADSEKLRQAWIQAVQASIASAYRESPDSYYIERLDRTASPSTSSIDSATDSRERGGKGETILQRVQSIPGNEQCCDCGQPDPRWASINLGILLCIECSGIHRSLGVHCSKVRSLTLDSWEPELLKLMCELGNSTMNQIYEAQCEELGLKKPTAGSSRQDKEAWIKVKYVEKKFLKKLPGGEALAESERKPRRWCVKKCQRHNSGSRAPTARRKYRQETGNASPAMLSSAATLERKFRRDSLFCPDELDSLFSYFDTGAGSGPRSASHISLQHPLAGGPWSGMGPAGSLLDGGLSSDSGLGGSTDGSTDILVFGSVVDSVTEEECEVSEESSGEAEIEQEASDLEDLRELHPGLLMYRAAQARNLPLMAEALAHGAEINWVNDEDENKTPLIQAVKGGSLIACEFLLQNGADVNQRDSRGRAPLHHATYLGHTGQVCLFLKRGANQHAVDGDGQDPLSIAVTAANADIVTLLRLARMNEEMREAEGPFGQPGQYPSNSPTELQYRKCIQEFISLNIDEC